MLCVHYKFFSKLSYNTVKFEGLHITLSQLKKQIMVQERLSPTHCDLQITDAQSREEYTDGEAHIPIYSSVIVRRVPVLGVKSAGRAPKIVVSRGERCYTPSPTPAESSLALPLAKLLKTADICDTNASEEDKITAMMHQSSSLYGSMYYSKRTVRPPPANNTCFRCLKPGHYMKHCPMLMVQVRNGEVPKPVKTSKGIPRSFMVKVESGTKGAMLTSTGEYMIPAIHAEVYAREKKTHTPCAAPSAPPKLPSPKVSSHPAPEELLCPICNDLIRDAVTTPCCGYSYCDECIRTALLDSQKRTCFTCTKSHVSPDHLIPNRFLRLAVDDFKSIAGYNTTTTLAHKQVQHADPAPQSSQSISRSDNVNMLSHRHGSRSSVDSRKRMREEDRSVPQAPSGKLRRIPVLGGDVRPHPHLSDRRPRYRLPLTRMI
ncbi:E3 ubiquitin-protein ligase RBBP6-like [Solea senegalensis]|uniref:E3 ubiquitin-protein ligase RBBP6-like n=1 Tax=Solea senegalensis TaxID=28829 RepID=A0AAV6RQW3_SOLSE|nr:E3 ubiquitin-protein ligase RBBP6-like [Solea senegalensis]